MSGIDLLTVRPRVTELVDFGFATCVGRDAGEGLYRALSYAQAIAKFTERQALGCDEGVQTTFL